MIKQITAFALLLVCLFLYGCGSSSGNCNLSLGGAFHTPEPVPGPTHDPVDPVDPVDPPEPEDPSHMIIRGTVINPVLNAPDGLVVPDVEVGYYNGQIFIPLGQTDVDGNFEVELDGFPGDNWELVFRKLGFDEDNGYGYIIDTLAGTIDANGNPVYNETDPICAYLNICSAENISIVARTLIDLTSEKIHGSYAAFSLSPDEKYLYVSDYETSNNPNDKNRRLARIKMDTIYDASPQIEYIAGVMNNSFYTSAQPRGITFSKDGTTMYVSEWGDSIPGRRILKYTGLNDPNGVTAPNDAPTGLHQDTKFYNCFVLAGTGANGHDDGDGDQATFGSIAQMVLADSATEDDEDILYLADATNHKIRKIERISTATQSSDVTVSTVAGTNAGSSVDGTVGVSPEPTFNQPYALALTKDQDTLYVGDAFAGRLRKLTNLRGPGPIKVVTLAGNTRTANDSLYYGDPAIQGKDARFFAVFGIALSADEDVIFIADCGNNGSNPHENCKIKKVTGLLNAGADEDSSSKVLVSVFAGSGEDQSTDGVDDEIELGYAGGIVLNADNTAIYFFERFINSFRVIHPFEAGTSPVPAP